MKQLVQRLVAAVCIAVAAVMGSVVYYDQTLPASFYTHDGNVYIHAAVTADSRQTGAVRASDTLSTAQNTTLRLFGLFPIKQTHVTQVSERVLVPCGTPFGIKLNTDGVLVVGLGEIRTKDGTRCPAREAGVKLGDAIVSVNSRTVLSNEDIESLVLESGGEVVLSVRRDGKLRTVQVEPAADETGGRRLGLWVRDSSAGIGTITFYDPQTHTFGGLGHPICDVDTGEVMPLLSGEVVRVRINDVVKGRAGEPGELKGSFTEQNGCGTVTVNNDTGVYGTLVQSPSDNAPVPIALKQQVHYGDAQIYTTIDGTKPELYTIRIEQIHLNDAGKTKNMVIRVTDPKLLERTGGIVQGMSGSPILQDGRLVGAVTHVLVNDPQKGYAIFIENMYDNLGATP